MVKIIKHILYVVFITSIAYSHPTTFKDGIVLSNTYENNRNDFNAHYSLTHKSALGIHLASIDSKNNEDHFLFVKTNYLFKRYNLENAQGNLYYTIGPGLALDRGNSVPALVSSLQADYETRTFYTQLNLESIHSENSYDRGAYRIGFAPYKAAFDELQTFLIAEIAYANKMEDAVVGGPVVRLFTHWFLTEVGVRTNGDVMFTLMFHL